MAQSITYRTVLNRFHVKVTPGPFVPDPSNPPDFLGPPGPPGPPGPRGPATEGRLRVVSLLFFCTQ